MVQHLQIMLYHINKMDDKNHIIPIDLEKAFDRIQHPFMVNTSQHCGYRGNITRHHQGPI